MGSLDGLNGVHWFGNIILTEPHDRSLSPEDRKILEEYQLHPEDSPIDANLLMDLLMGNIFSIFAHMPQEGIERDPRIGEIIILNSPNHFSLFEGQFPTQISDSRLYVNKDGELSRLKTELAVGFGLPVFADFRGLIDLLTEFRYNSTLLGGKVYHLHELEGFEQYKWSGLQFEFFNSEGNTGVFLYRMPWSRASDAFVKKITKEVSRKFTGEEASYVGYRYGESDYKLMAKILKDKHVDASDEQLEDKKQLDAVLGLLAEFAGMPHFANSSGFSMLNALPIEVMTQNYNRLNIIHSFVQPDYKTHISPGHSESTVNAVTISDIAYSPSLMADGTVKMLHELSPKLFVEKKVEGERQHTLSPATEYQMLQWCRVAWFNNHEYEGINIPEVRLFGDKLYVQYIEGTDLGVILESQNLDSQTTYRHFKAIKQFIGSVHRALKAAETDYPEFSDSTLTEIKTMYENEWDALYRRMGDKSEFVKSSIGNIDLYFESKGFKKQILADFSPNNLKINEVGYIVKFDMNYPAYDFTQLDFAVAVYYNPNFKIENREAAIDAIIEGQSEMEKALTFYSFLKKNIYGYLFFSGKDDAKSNHRLLCAIDNYNKLSALVDKEGLNELRPQLNMLGDYLKLAQPAYVEMNS